MNLAWRSQIQLAVKRIPLSFGGFHTKKYIIIGATLLVCVAAFVVGVILTTRSISPDVHVDFTKKTPTDIDVPILTYINAGAAAAEPAQPRQTADSEDTPTYTADNIPAVTGLTRLSNKEDNIHILWDELPGVDGFRIYRRNDNKEDADFMLFSIVKTAGLRITHIEPGSKYTFRIVPYIKDKKTVKEGEAAEITFGTVPTDVENFRMTDETETTISMSWDKNERADGYMMERCCKGKWSDYQTFDTDTTEFTDTDLEPGRAYYYRIWAYREDSDGKMPGAKSAIRTVAGLLGPEDDDSASKLGRVSLDYKESKFADGYSVYYSKDKENWEKLGDTERTHFSTSRLENGETYFFRIYPYKEVDGYDVEGAYTELEFVAKKEIYDKEVGDTYVEVSLDDQHMWYIVDGDVYLESDCVTGNYGTADTPKGYYSVNAKISPCTLKGDDYTSYVTYWMPFIGGGWGLHDADWRSSFGGSIYKGNGSHGCVNLPPSIAKEMYAVIEVGTPVIVY